MRLRSIKKKLSGEGEAVSSQFFVCLNNEPVRSYETEQEVIQYVKSYLEFNQIFSFELYKSTLIKLN